MISRWASNLFKGRIGEAVVEAVLTEFGYKVRRGGYELAFSGNVRYAPDLVVDQPVSGERKFVEVKFRSSRPTSVQLDIGSISAYKKQFPGTIIAICSAYDGSIFCAEVEDLPLQKASGKQDLNLLDDYWQPIWIYFPLVVQGERLRQTWSNLQETMAAYGTRQVATRRKDRLWVGEYEALADYIDDSWTDELESFGIQQPDPDNMTLDELWRTAREINAVAFAEELLQPAEDNLVESSTMLLAVKRVLDRRGEGTLSLHLPSLAEEIGLDSQSVWLLAALIAGLMKPSDDERKEKASRLVRSMRDGVGEVYLADAGVSFENSQRVDLKTAIKLFTNPCRIDR